MQQRTYKITIRREGKQPTVIIDSRLDVIADIYQLSVADILWAIESEGRCETEHEGAEVTIEEL